MNRTITTVLAVGIFGILQAQTDTKAEIGRLLDEWHRAAGQADFDAYFLRMTDDAVFIGTDATEYWKGETFRDFSRPYFERGKAWDFTTVQRHIYVSETGNIAWFDELLDTQMELCRGSGVVQWVDGSWKIAHYVLSIAVPNENVAELIKLKKQTDSLLKQKLLTH